MSISLIVAIFANPPCKGGELLVLLNLAKFASDNGDRCFPSVARVARETAQTRRAVEKQLVGLQAKGLIEVLHRRFARTTQYRVCVEKLSTQCEPRSQIQSGPKPPTANMVPTIANVVRTNCEPRPDDSLLDSSSKSQKHEEKPKGRTKAGIDALESIRNYLPNMKKRL